MEDPICCESQIDRFLAHTPVKLIGIEKVRKTVKETKTLGKELDDSLDAPCPEGFWTLVNLEMQKNLLEQQKEYLLDQKVMER